MSRFSFGKFLFLLTILQVLSCIAEGEWGLTTNLKLESVWWPQSYGDDTNNTLNRLQLIPALSGKYGDSVRLFFKPELFLDPQNKSTEEQVFLNVGEAYYKYKTPTSSVQLGSNILNWGVTDAYNPLDVVNPRQYYDPLHAKKLGVWSMLLSHSSEYAEQELIYIPKSQPSMLPGPNSRWLPREVYVPRTPDNDVVLLLPDNLHYTYDGRETLNHAFDNNIAARLQWHLGSIDIGVSGYDGVALFPIVEPEVTGTIIQISPYTVIQTDPNVILHTKSYRIHEAGFSWVSSQWDFLLKYAGSYSQSLGDDPLLPGWMIENVMGLEKNFNIGRDGLLVAVLQYSFLHDQKENDSNLTVTEIFRRAWMYGGRFSWGDNWSYTIAGLYDTLHYSHYEEYSVARRLFDVWTLQLTADFIAGHNDTPLGIYNSNDNYSLSLSRSF